MRFAPKGSGVTAARRGHQLGLLDHQRDDDGLQVRLEPDATFHNWWKEGRVRLKGYVKGRYYRKVGAASADGVEVETEVTFLSLY